MLDSKKAPNIRSVIEPKHTFVLAVTGGMACHWLWSYIATVTAADIFFWEARDSVASHALFYPISLTTLIATIAVNALVIVKKGKRNAIPVANNENRTAFIAAAITCSSTFCLIWAQSDTAAGITLLIISGLGTGIGSGMLLPLCWSKIIQYLSTKAMLTAFAASNVLSFSALLFVKLIPHELAAILACILPIAEAVCFLGANRLKDPHNEPKTIPYRNVKVAQTLLRIGVPSAIFGMILGLLQELSVTRIINSSDIASQAVLVMGSLFAASLVLCSFALFSRGERHALAQVLFLVTIISLSLVFSYQISEEFTLMAVLIANVSLHLMVWMFALKIVRQGGIPSLLAFSALYGSTCLGTALSVVPMKFLPSINELLGGSAIWPVGIVASFAIAYSFWPSKKDIETYMITNEKTEDEEGSSFRRACQSVSEQYALSPRETEVLTLIAQGRSIAYIGEELFISPNTVKSHRRRLYEKLGIHKNQEVISLVQAEMAGDELKRNE